MKRKESRVCQKCLAVRPALDFRDRRGMCDYCRMAKEWLCRDCQVLKPRKAFPDHGRVCRECKAINLRLQREEPEVRARHLSEARKWAQENQQRVTRNQALWYLKNRDAILGGLKTQRMLEPERLRLRSWRSIYGPTHAEWYRKQLEIQHNRCAFCRRTAEESRTKLHSQLTTDHDHAFARKDPAGWRRLLCARCNAGYGYFGEDSEALDKAAKAALADAARRTDKAA